VPLELIHCDASLVAVNKPAGLLAHPSKLAAGEREDLLTQLRLQTGRAQLKLVHRLDRASSGVLLACDDPTVHAALGHAFERREVHKRYLAVVRGWPGEDAGEIDKPLSGEAKRSPLKPALTRYRVLARCQLPWPSGRWETARYALVEASPETGRYRQIRRHFKHLGHPLVGDTSFGKGEHNRLFRIQLGVHRLLLHAFELRFKHPADQPMQLRASVDADWHKVLGLFELDASSLASI
jgi:tRNA pseudouridine65 synthase